MDGEIEARGLLGRGSVKADHLATSLGLEGNRRAFVSHSCRSRRHSRFPGEGIQSGLPNETVNRTGSARVGIQSGLQQGRARIMLFVSRPSDLPTDHRLQSRQQNVTLCRV